MNSTNDLAQESREALARSLHQIISEAEAMLDDARKGGTEQFDQVRERFESQVRVAKAELGRLEHKTRDQLRRAGDATDQAVRDHPYAAVGLAAGVGLLIGMLISRR